MTCRPWEGAALSVPAMSGTVPATPDPTTASASTLYPRVVEVHRSRTNSVDGSGNPQVGLVGYSGREADTSTSDPEGEIVLFTGIAAQIALKRSGKTTGLTLPSDSINNPTWTITIPGAALPIYSVRDRDILVDDEGYRYSVTGNYWLPTGYQLDCIRLEA